MSIPTSRTKEKATIILHTELCIGCGACVDVCKDFNFILKDGVITLSETPIFGCIACGHCVAICPTGAIEIEGRCFSKNDLFDLSDIHGITDYNSLMGLLKKRRSVREYTDQEVSHELIQKVIEAAQFSPMGLPPSDVHVMVLDSREKNNQFAHDFCNYLESMRWFVSGWFLALMRPFWGKANDEMFKGFVKPLFDIYINSNQKGENMVTYDAPALLYFYGSPYTDPADPIVAATVAMYAAESLGLGTCMLGGIHPLIQNGNGAKKLREKYGIKYKSREGLFLIVGHPKPKYRKGIQRSFAEINYY
jgi:ferredoxin